MAALTLLVIEWVRFVVQSIRSFLQAVEVAVLWSSDGGTVAGAYRELPDNRKEAT